MRDILFRGKRVDDGEWVYGSFVMDATEQLGGGCGADGYIRSYNRETKKVEMYEVQRETVGQYIGLTSNYGESDGRKIFEGDVVNVYSFTGKRDKRYATVEWDSYFLHWAAGGSSLYSDEVIEIVGNIHNFVIPFGGADNGE